MINENALSFKNVFFKYTLDTMNEGICSPKLVMQIIYIILLLLQIRNTIIYGSYLSGFFTLIGLLFWIYINLLYQTKLCGVESPLGNSIRIHELFFILIKWIPLLLFILVLYIASSWLATSMTLIKPVSTKFTKGFTKEFNKKTNKKDEDIDNNIYNDSN